MNRRPWLLSPCVQLLEEVESRALRGAVHGINGVYGSFGIIRICVPRDLVYEYS